VDIISKRSGPREEDKHAKNQLRHNWGTIEKLADQISGGSYSANKARASAGTKPAGPQASGTIFVDQSPRRPADPSAPYLRISSNGRVVLADSNSGRQLHFLGELKRRDGAVRFIMATAANGYVTPLEAELQTMIGASADAVLGHDYSEDDLFRDLSSCLGLAEANKSQSDEPTT
jgi:hypothetical protein